MAESPSRFCPDADLRGLRCRIDKLDEMLLAIIAERCAVVGVVQRLKRENGLPVRCSEREQQIFSRARGLGRCLGIAEEDASAIVKAAIDCCLRNAELTEPGTRSDAGKV